ILLVEIFGKLMLQERFSRLVVFDLIVFDKFAVAFDKNPFILWYMICEDVVFLVSELENTSENYQIILVHCHREAVSRLFSNLAKKKILSKLPQVANPQASIVAMCGPANRISRDH